MINSLVLDDIEFVQMLLAMGADPNASCSEGQTVMHLAARYGSLDVLKLLIEHGALVQDQNLLPHAVSCIKDNEARCVEVIRLLLDHGAPIDAYYGEHIRDSGKSTFGTTSVTLMVWGKQNALHLAISDGMRELVKLLISRGADKSLPGWSVMRPMNGQTLSPVEIARACGHNDIVELLEGEIPEMGISPS